MPSDQKSSRRHICGGFFSGIAVGVFVLVFLLIGFLMVAFGGFTIEDTMPSEEDYNYSDDKVQS